MPAHRPLLTILAASVVLAAACVAGTAGAPGPSSSPLASARAAAHRAALAKVEARWAQPATLQVEALPVPASLGVTITQFKAKIGTKVKASAFRLAADDPGQGGADDTEVLESTATCRVALGNGAPHDIAVTSGGYPAMSDHEDVMQVDDTTANVARTYAADQEFMRFKVSGDGETLTVVHHPDDTVSVNGQPATTLEAAAKLIAATKLVRTTSIEGLAVLAALIAGQDEVAEDTLAPCTPPQQNNWGRSQGDVISTQAVGEDDGFSLTDLIEMVIAERKRAS